MDTCTYRREQQTSFVSTLPFGTTAKLVCMRHAASDRTLYFSNKKANESSQLWGQYGGSIDTATNIVDAVVTHGLL